jgi:hypothetical protein
MKVIAVLSLIACASAFALPSKPAAFVAQRAASANARALRAAPLAAASALAAPEFDAPAAPLAVRGGGVGSMIKGVDVPLLLYFFFWRVLASRSVRFSASSSSLAAHAPRDLSLAASLTLSASRKVPRQLLLQHLEQARAEGGDDAHGRLPDDHRGGAAPRWLRVRRPPFLVGCVCGLTQPRASGVAPTIPRECFR